MTDLRARIREAADQHPAKKGKTAAERWQPITMADLAPGTVLSFDQTLTKTGWTLLQHDGQQVEILGGGLLKPHLSMALKSHEDTYDRGLKLAAMVERLLSSLPMVCPVVFERPAVHGFRTESSLLAGFIVTQKVMEQHRMLPTAVSKVHAAALLVHPDKDRRSKAQVKAAVEALVPAEQRHNLTSWNQDVSDSAANGIAWLYDEQKRLRSMP